MWSAGGSVRDSIIDTESMATDNRRSQVLADLGKEGAPAQGGQQEGDAHQGRGQGDEEV